MSSSYSEKLTELIKDHGARPYSLAPLVGTSRQVLERAMKGITELRFVTAKRLAEQLGMSLDEFCFKLGLTDRRRQINKSMIGYDLDQMRRVYGYKRREKFAKDIGMSTTGVVRPIYIGTAGLTLSKAVKFAEFFNINIDQFYDQTAEPPKQPEKSEIRKTIDALENELNINLENCSVDKFTDFLKAYLELTLINNSYNLENVREAIKTIVDENGEKVSNAPWKIYDAKYYSDVINGSDITNRKPSGNDLIRLIRSLGYDGAKSLNDIINIKPEDYNRNKKTLKCGDRILQISSRTENLLNINQSMDTILEWRRIMHYYPYQGSLIKFPTALDSIQESDLRPKATVIQSIRQKYRYYYPVKLDFENLNARKIYDKLKVSMDKPKMEKTIENKETLKTWLLNHKKSFAFTDDELNDDTFINEMAIRLDKIEN